MAWPRYIAFKSATNNKYLSYKKSPEGIASSGDDVWKPSTKFDLELPNNLNLENMFHIRCCFNNKFLWCPVDSGSPIRFADKADEDDTKTSGTLFKLEHVNKDEEKVQIQHVGTEQYLQVEQDGDNFLVSGSASPTGDSSYVFEVIDGDKLIRMPEYVAFKVDNEKYLRIHWHEDNPFLQFSSDDKSGEDVVQRIFHNPDGTINIKHKQSDKFWSLISSEWIMPSVGQEETNNNYTMFQPVRVDDSTVALRSLSNQRFCRRFTNGVPDVLQAGVSIIDRWAKLKMVELVFSRHIYDVRYRFEHARTYDHNSAIVGTGTVTNKDGCDKELQVKVAIKYTNTRSWRNSFNWNLGVKTTVESNVIPLIIGAKWEFSVTFGGTHELGGIESDEVQFETTVKEKVPKYSRCTVNAIAKVAKCDAPYSYLKRDFLYDGKSNIAFMDDGVYHGVQYVEINHETAHQPLPEPKDPKSN